MRIDGSDQPEDAHVARRAQSAPDDPNAAGKDQGKAVGGDGPHDSFPAPIDSALRIERAVAYRAAVDVAYRQYAIDNGHALVEEPERETASPAIRRIESEDPGDARRDVARTMPVLARNADGLGSVARETAAADVPTGARGPASGREFDPEAAGGPIQQLDARTARITDEGVQKVAAHLRRFTGGGSLDAPEQGMLDRLTSIASGGMKPMSYDLNFFTHELDEAGRYAQLGFGPESGVDLGDSEMYEVWNDVHTAALEDYGIRGADLFYPGLAS